MQLHATCSYIHACEEKLDHIKHCRNLITHHRRETASAFKTEQTHSSKSLSAWLESNTHSGEKERRHSWFGRRALWACVRSLSVCVCVCGARRWKDPKISSLTRHRTCMWLCGIVCILVYLVILIIKFHKKLLFFFSGG